jgi:polysaccharide biosynthesis transport protein
MFTEYLDHRQPREPTRQKAKRIGNPRSTNVIQEPSVGQAKTNAFNQKLSDLVSKTRYAADFLIKNKAMILSAAVIVVAVALVYIVFSTKNFSSTTYIYIDPRGSQLGNEQQLNGDFALASSLVESQVQLIESERIAQSVISRLDMAQSVEPARPSALNRFKRWIGILPLGESDGSDAMGSLIQDLHSKLTVRRLSMTFIIAVTYVSRDPSIARKVSQAFADAYIDELLKSTKQANGLASDWLRGRLETLREQARSADRALEDFRSKSADADPVALDDLQSGSQVARVTYESFLQRFTDMVQQQSFPVTNARIASDASIPERTGPRNSIILLSAALLGVLLGVGLSLLRAMSGEIRKIREFANAT